MLMVFLFLIIIVSFNIIRRVLTYHPITFEFRNFLQEFKELY